jgi:hypothetical protein
MTGAVARTEEEQVGGTSPATGCFVDNAKGNVVYAGGVYGHRGRTWDGILRQDELKRVPLEHYRVLKLGPITHMGDSRQPNVH